MSSSHNETAIAFIAGSLLPTLAWWWLGRRKEDEAESDDEDDVPRSTTGASSSSWGMIDAPYKMLLAVNTDLGMGKGKIAAQCGHAAVGCYTSAQKQCPAALRAWNRTGCAKIAVKVPSTDALELLAVAASERGIPFYLVEDAGRTQIAAGSKTVLGLFAPVAAFDGFTDHLKLL